MLRVLPGHLARPQRSHLLGADVIASLQNGETQGALQGQSHPTHLDIPSSHPHCGFNPSIGKHRLHLFAPSPQKDGFHITHNISQNLGFGISCACLTRSASNRNMNSGNCTAGLTPQGLCNSATFILSSSGPSPEVGFPGIIAFVPLMGPCKIADHDGVTVGVVAKAAAQHGMVVP